MALTILQVFIKVKPEKLDVFKAATIENSRATLKEPLCARFDVIQELDDPTRFVLYEAYHGDGHAAHRETEHYKKWRDTVNDWMAEPRSAKKYSNLCPDDDEF
jgi:autoinducer 2-degrading protein